MWPPVDVRFHRPRHPVAIADCGGVGGEAAMLRGLLEQLRGVVLLHHMGTPSDLLLVFGQSDQVPPHVILCAHRDDNGIVFGEYITAADTSMLVDGRLPPARIGQHIRLPGCVVINTACGAGEETMAAAFVRGPIKAYIGALAQPDAETLPLFVASFCHRLFVARSCKREARKKASLSRSDSRQYLL